MNSNNISWDDQDWKNINYHVRKIQKRISEAAKLGFKRIIIPEFNRQQLPKKTWGIEIIGVNKVEEAFRTLFG